MIEADIYDDATGEKLTIKLYRNDLAYEYIIDWDKDGNSVEHQGTIYNVDTLPMLEIVKVVLGALDG